MFAEREIVIILSFVSSVTVRFIEDVVAFQNIRFRPVLSFLLLTLVKVLIIRTFCDYASNAQLTLYIALSIRRI